MASLTDSTGSSSASSRGFEHAGGLRLAPSDEPLALVYRAPAVIEQLFQGCSLSVGLADDFVPVRAAAQLVYRHQPIVP